MVRKLFKHELLFYWRLILPVQIALLGVALLGRFTQLFESDTVVYDVVSTGTIIIFALSAVASLLLTTIFCIVRFYKNLFSGEGYLTFTLPVSPTKHLVVKLLTAVLMELLAFFGVCLSICVITDTGMLIEIGKALGFLYDQAGEVLGADRVHLAIYFVELGVLYLVNCFYQVLVLYLCIALGQLFHKNRVFAAVGMFFAYFLITQIITTIVSSIFSSLFFNISSLMDLIYFVGRHPYATIHILFIAAIVISAGLAILFFFLTRWIIRRKLNLE